MAKRKEVKEITEGMTFLERMEANQASTGKSAENAAKNRQFSRALSNEVSRQKTRVDQLANETADSKAAITVAEGALESMYGNENFTVKKLAEAFDAVTLAKANLKGCQKALQTGILTQGKFDNAHKIMFGSQISYDMDELLSED